MSNEVRREMWQSMTDTQFLLSVLNDGKPHSLNEILLRSLKERGCGLTVHSRAADLRKSLREEGYTVVNTKKGWRGNGSLYQLVPLRETPTLGAGSLGADEPFAPGQAEDAPSPGGASDALSPSSTGVETAAAPVPLFPVDRHHSERASAA